MMDKEQRIYQLEKEIERFDFQRLKKLELAQQMQVKLQEELNNINVGILTRRGEVICLKGLMTEEERKKDEKKVRIGKKK